MSADHEVDVAYGLPYLPGGKLLDLYRPLGTAGPSPAVLLWHGIGGDERDVLAPLARATAARGVSVYVPDWRADDPGSGRSQLLASLEYVRERAAGQHGGRLVAAGWSAGASAAVGLALRPGAAGAAAWRPTAVVGIAGRYDLRSFTTGTCLLDDLAEGVRPQCPVRLLHGADDPVVPARHTRDFVAAASKDPSAEVTYEESGSDHAGVIMTEYDPTTDRCVPTTAEHAVRSGGLTVRTLADAAGVTAA